MFVCDNNYVMRNLLHTRKFDYRKEQTKRYSRKGFGKKDIAYIILTFTIILTVGIQMKHNVLNIQLPQAQAVYYASPLPLNNYMVITTPTITPTPTMDNSENTRYNEIDNEIKRVFGSYYPRAMQLLSCENNSLNPEAINTAGNFPEGSMDVGVFQINQYWNKVDNIDILKDPYINIAIAWKKFKDSGYNFNQWTCGRNMGI